MKDKFLEVYLEDIISNNNLINEDYHNPPLLGWNKDRFSKVLIEMLKHSIKKFAANEFDNYFLSSDLFSFKKLFKLNIKDENIIVGGEGRKFKCTLKYIINVEENSNNILNGEGPKNKNKLRSFME